MNIPRSMNRTGSSVVDARSRSKPDAFADPLESAEWDGLGWAIPLIAHLVAGARPNAKNQGKVNQVQRFTSSRAAKGVCVS